MVMRAEMGLWSQTFENGLDFALEKKTDKRLKLPEQHEYLAKWK